MNRHERRTGEHAEKGLAPVLQNSLAWGGFLAVSSNTRYQLVAAIEERILVSPLAAPGCALPKAGPVTTANCADDVYTDVGPAMV